MHYGGHSREASVLRDSICTIQWSNSGGKEDAEAAARAGSLHHKSQT
jgi:hypothetical protein